ncbi:MAG: glycosyltransferase family 2 protein [Anaerolineales bacterium]|nr:glycosyltransferase family 2 protein [Anaerolineales bacterium]
MKISIVMPCYNELNTIKTIIDKVLAVELDQEKELIIVDDGSQDGTREFLSTLNGNSNIKLVLHPRNRGKGAALRTGFENASGDIIIIQDADLEYEPNEYPRLIESILTGRADVVYGSRFIGSESHRVLYFWHSMGNKFLTLLSNVFTNHNLIDMEVCYKVFKRSILNDFELKEDRFGFEPEFTAKIAKGGYTLYEVGISYYGRTFAEGKKINWKDGFRAIYVILKYGLFN